MKKEFIENFNIFLQHKEEFIRVSTSVIEATLKDFNQAANYNYSMNIDSIDGTNIKRLEFKDGPNSCYSGYMEENILWFCIVGFIKILSENPSFAYEYFSKQNQEIPLKAYTNGIDYTYSIIMGEYQKD